VIPNACSTENCDCRCDQQLTGEEASGWRKFDHQDPSIWGGLSMAISALGCPAKSRAALTILSNPRQVSWIARNRELHPVPLFVTAAGIEAVLSPDTTLKLSGRDLMEALARRERLRIDLIGNNIENTRWANRLTALGLLSGGVPLTLAKDLANSSRC
jgi:hypothetical protein